jgi:hypothetical protein
MLLLAKKEPAMAKRLVWLGMTLLLLATVVLVGQTANAAGVVGNGTATSCTEAAFDGALAGGGIVSFNCGTSPHTIVLTAQKAIVANTIIDGGNVITLDGNNATRHFFVNGVSLTLNNIALTKGASPAGGGAIEANDAQIVLNNTRITASAATDQGGAIYCFVNTNGTLTLNNSIISGNTSRRGGGVFNSGCPMTVNNSQLSNNRTVGANPKQGGAIYNEGPLVVAGSTLQGNDGFDGGALYVAAGSGARLSNTTIISNTGNFGGGIENSGALTVTDSLLIGNSAAGSGGGIWNLNGSVVLSRTSVLSNTAFEGGGINSYGNSVQLTDVNIMGNSAGTSGGGGIFHNAGTFFVTNATISGNRAVGATSDGGGIYQNADDNLALTNVTLSENAAGRFGGALYHKARFAILTNVTIGPNTATAGPAIYEDAVVSPSAPGVVQIRNSVLFGNANACGGAIFDTLGNNIVAGTCGSIGHATDQNVPDARLGPLAFNGGSFSMQTHLPLAGSPLINAANAGACPAADQRGAPRVGNCDIGAVEFDATAPTPIPTATTTTTATTTPIARPRRYLSLVVR